MNYLNEIYTCEEIAAKLREAIDAKASKASRGAVQEVKVGNRSTRFHPDENKDLDKWIRDLRDANSHCKGTPVRTGPKAFPTTY